MPAEDYPAMTLPLVRAIRPGETSVVYKFTVELALMSQGFVPVVEPIVAAGGTVERWQIRRAVQGEIHPVTDENISWFGLTASTNAILLRDVGRNYPRGLAVLRHPDQDFMDFLSEALESVNFLRMRFLYSEPLEAGTVRWVLKS